MRCDSRRLRCGREPRKDGRDGVIAWPPGQPVKESVCLPHRFTADELMMMCRTTGMFARR